LHFQYKLQIGFGEIGWRHAGAVFRETINGRLNAVRGFHVIGGGVRVRAVIVVGLKLDALDVVLEGSDGHCAWILFAPVPEQVQADGKDAGKSINVLVPCAVEITEEQYIVVLKFFAFLATAKVRELFARDDDPAREVNEREIDQVVVERFDVAEEKNEDTEKDRFPGLHRRDGGQRISFAVNVSQVELPLRNPGNYSIRFVSVAQLEFGACAHRRCGSEQRKESEDEAAIRVPISVGSFASLLHKDPIDRILIAQAIEHGLTLATPDPLIQQYAVRTVWDRT
jgi:hypothetical protein